MKVRIDPQTREIIHPIELREVEFLGGGGSAPAVQPRAEDRCDMTWMLPGIALMT